MSNSEEIKHALRKARQSRSPAVEAEDRRVRRKISELIASQEITQDEVTRGVLRAQLKISGEVVTVPGVGQRSRLHDWTPGLYTNDDVTAFDYIGGTVDRDQYEALSRDVKETHAPKLLRDLVRKGLLDLAAQDMEGVVAEAWSLGEPYASGVDGATWVSLFESNGFVYLGRRADRPTEPLDLFRGATDGTKRGMSWSTDVDVARRFAHDRISSRPVGNVYCARVAPQLLLAYIDEGHEEKEWVVDPRGLRDEAIALYEGS